MSIGLFLFIIFFITLRSFRQEKKLIITAYEAGLQEGREEILSRNYVVTTKAMPPPPPQPNRKT